MREASEEQAAIRSEILGKSEQWRNFTKDLLALTSEVRKRPNPAGLDALLLLSHAAMKVRYLRRKLSRRFGVRIMRLQSQSSGAVQWSRWSDQFRVNQNSGKEARRWLRKKWRLTTDFYCTFGEWMRARFILDALHSRMQDAVSRGVSAKELDTMTFETLQAATIESVTLRHVHQIVALPEANDRWPSLIALSGAVRSGLDMRHDWRLGKALGNEAGAKGKNNLLLDELPGAIGEVLAEERPKGKEVGSLKTITNAAANRIIDTYSAEKALPFRVVEEITEDDDYISLEERVGDDFTASPIEEALAKEESRRQVYRHNRFLDYADLGRREAELLDVMRTNPDAPQTELAAQLGMKPNTVRATLFHVRKKFTLARQIVDAVELEDESARISQPEEAT